MRALSKSRLWKSLGLVTCITLLASCGGKSPDATGGAEGKTLRDYKPEIGTSRLAVEEKLGEPTYIGRTKGGDLLCVYQIEGERAGIHTTVSYDRDGEVSFVYR